MSSIFIVKEEMKVEKPSLFSDIVDIGILFNSSESRALCYSSLFKDKSITKAVLVNFGGSNSQEKALNLEKNLSGLKRIAKDVVLLECDDIFDYLLNLNRIADIVLEEQKNMISRRLFMDASGAPLIYSTALLKFFLRLFPSPEVLVLNVSGSYAERGAQQFSAGDQTDIYIPGYYGTPDHSKPFHYVFLLGYEGERSFSIYREHLPEKVSVIIPSPGYDEGNDQNTINANLDFLSDIGCIERDGDIVSIKPNKKVHRIDISDIQGVKQRIETIYEEDAERYEIRLVPLGPKPHALGAALAAVFNNNISMMYHVPKKYYLSEIPPSKKMWLYHIHFI